MAWRSAAAIVSLMLAGCIGNPGDAGPPETVIARSLAPEGKVDWPAPWPDCPAGPPGGPSDNVQVAAAFRGTRLEVAQRVARAANVRLGAEASSTASSTTWAFASGTLTATDTEHGGVEVSFTSPNWPGPDREVLHATLQKIAGAFVPPESAWNVTFVGRGLNGKAVLPGAVPLAGPKYYYESPRPIRSDLTIAQGEKGGFHGSFEPLYDVAAAGPLLEPWQAMCRAMEAERGLLGDETLAKYRTFEYRPFEVLPHADGLALAYPIAHEWGEATESGCDGHCHGCPAPGTLLHIDAETGALLRTHGLHPCY